MAGECKDSVAGSLINFSRFFLPVVKPVVTGLGTLVNLKK